MFRKLVALLMLLVPPAFAQEVPPPPAIMDPTATQTYTLTVLPQTNLDLIQNTGTAANLGDDGTLPGVDIGFNFYFYGNMYDKVNISQNGFISFTSLANGCCSGMPLPNFMELTEFNQTFFNYYNTHNTIFAMWSDLISFTGNPYYQSFENKFTVGWYDVEELGSYRQDCQFNLFGLPLFCNNIGPNKFDFEITLHSNNDIAIRYGSFDTPVNTGRPITSGIQGDQPGEFWQIYFGSDVSTLGGKTYVFNSSEVVPIVPDPPVAPDCTINPTDPTCIINDIIDTTEPVYVADTDTGSDTGSDDGSTTFEEMLADEEEEEEQAAEEEMLAAAEEAFEDVADEQEEALEEALEELLAEQEEDAEEMVEEAAVVATYRELTDEEKAAILADAISKNTLEAALSIASAAENNAVAQGGAAGEATSTSESSKTSTIVAAVETVSETTSTSTTADLLVETTKEESSTSESSNAGADILEAGRQLGQAALATTLTGASESAAESTSQAENIAASSSAESQVASTSGSSVVDTGMSVDVSVSAESKTEETAVAEVQMETTEQFTESNEVNVADVIQQSEQSSAVDFTTVDAVMEMFAGNVSSQMAAAAEQEQLENNVIQQSIAASLQQEETRDTFSEAEVVTIANDPALANAFNIAPNMANLEVTGVLSQKQEEKSDAELRAEQVVAANKDEQDKINSNYMEADQSGIVAAIGADTDVTSYRTAMLRDNNVWYKPEDIYKNIVIKDNVRGSYFLEKGNTDTYKQMVEEQYK